MPIIKRFLTTATAIAMIALPVAASAAPANPAASLSVARARAATPVKGANRLEGSKATIVNIGILAVLVGGVLLLTTSGNDDETPDSA